MTKKNCWEFMKCGREPGGKTTAKFGVCPATVSKEGDGINYGENSGRICWAIVGTFCNDEIQGLFAQKRKVCIDCVFFKKVEKEESKNFQLLIEGQTDIIEE